MVKIVIAGAAGRMGQILVRCASGMDDIELVGAIEHDQSPALGEDAGVIAGIGKTGVIIDVDLQDVLMQGDVLIDFTLHSAVPGNVATAAHLGRAVVLGTTGLTEEESSVVTQAADKIPIVRAPNMSLGVNVLFDAVKQAASVLGSGYAVEIEETHHIHKKDAPSGTAIGLCEKVAEGLGEDSSKIMLHDPDGSKGLKDPSKIVVRSYRKGEVVGDHTVSFENASEKIEFTHHGWNRDAFAIGALRAALWVVCQKPRIYSMQDVLSL